MEAEIARQIRACHLPLPEREHRFHPQRRWRFDFAWPDRLIAAEVDGGIWRPGGGAHSRPANIMRDIEKHNAALLLGWRVLRFTPQSIRSGEAIALLELVLLK